MAWILREIGWIGIFSLGLCWGCKDTDGDGAPTGLGGAGGQPGDECELDEECEDGAYCNGRERCEDGYCRAGSVPLCDDGIDCTIDRCSHTQNTCVFEAPDNDGDGHADAACRGPSGEALGDDCDDNDPERYPGNVEVCTLSEPEHDEDCDPTTFGHLDADFDGEISSACCNEDEEGERYCGTDCDDDDPRRFAGHPEICDDIDNDCDGEVDNNTREVLWYPDADGDQYGEVDSDGTLSCVPIEGASLRDTDCDDTRASVHPAAGETCNGRDDDCDGEIDEGDVCLCSNEGANQACSCGPGETGTQTCAGGRLSACDCDECVSGQSDCFGGILPRTCAAGRWIVGTACTGLFPICQAGACVCADGTENCVPLLDVVPPYVVGSYPAQNAEGTPVGATLAIVFSEAMASSSLSDGSVVLVDGRGVTIEGTLAVSDTSLTFTPNQPLLPGMEHYLSVSSSAHDLSDNSLTEDFVLHFITTSGIALQPIDPAVTTATGVSLSVAPSGHRELVTMYNATTNMTSEDIVKRYRWEEEEWIGLDEIVGLTQSSIFIDESGSGVLLDATHSNLATYDITPSSWTHWEQDWGIDFSPGGAINGDGRTMVCWTLESQLFVMRRDGVTSWTSSSSNTSSTFVGCAADVSENGWGVALGLSDVEIRLYILEPNNALSNQLLQHEGTVTEPRVAISQEGTIVGALIETRPRSPSGVIDSVATFEVTENGTWSVEPTFTPGFSDARSESDPHIAVDDSGAVFVSFVAGGLDLISMRRSAGTSFDEETVVSLPGAGAISTTELHVAPSGDAVLLWLQGSPADLWAAQYSTDTGWGAPARIESNPTSITTFDADMDATGKVHVAYVAAGRLQFLEF